MRERQKKYLVILGDGMADEPLAELGGKTPLEYARTPNMDRIACEGTMGLARTIPEGFEAGSDIANLGILGYDPRSCYTGRGPLEAASMGLEMAPGDIAYRCNLVTVVDGRMADFSAGHISSREGASAGYPLPIRGLLPYSEMIRPEAPSHRLRSMQWWSHRSSPPNRC